MLNKVTKASKVLSYIIIYIKYCNDFKVTEQIIFLLSFLELVKFHSMHCELCS